MAYERIDAHHHLWRYTAEDYPWMTAEMADLQRDFLVEDLIAATREAQISGTVAVQARQSVEETRWLSELAAKSKLIRGVVGWAPLIDADVQGILETLAALPKVKGMRHVLHDEADDDYMLRGDFNRGVSYLNGLGLIYDLLLFERHLPNAIAFADRHPNQIFVLDHIGKPRIRNGEIEPWKTNLQELARRENVYCKVSGMVTEADWKKWSDDGLKVYFDAVLEAFGVNRLMFGSDWPVVTVAATYNRWVQCVERATAQFSQDEQKKLWSETAVKVYKLNEDAR